ncbi:hypothetical protein B0H11DRAFT_2386364 [Mycena galericulata]|nr:hypothetical protein B0H11DRAFT_2386364 [Mycena galericulata]
MKKQRNTLLHLTQSQCTLFLLFFACSQDRAIFVVVLAHGKREANATLQDKSKPQNDNCLTSFSHGFTSPILPSATSPKIGRDAPKNPEVSVPPKGKGDVKVELLASQYTSRTSRNSARSGSGPILKAMHSLLKPSAEILNLQAQCEQMAAFKSDHTNFGVSTWCPKILAFKVSEFILRPSWLGPVPDLDSWRALLRTRTPACYVFG